MEGFVCVARSQTFKGSWGFGALNSSVCVLLLSLFIIPAKKSWCELLPGISANCIYLPVEYVFNVETYLDLLNFYMSSYPLTCGVHFLWPSIQSFEYRCLYSSGKYLSYDEWVYI